MFNRKSKTHEVQENLLVCPVCHEGLETYTRTDGVANLSCFKEGCDVGAVFIVWGTGGNVQAAIGNYEELSSMVAEDIAHLKSSN